MVQRVAPAESGPDEKPKPSKVDVMSLGEADRATSKRWYHDIWYSCWISMNKLASNTTCMIADQLDVADTRHTHDHVEFLHPLHPYTHTKAHNIYMMYERHIETSLTSVNRVWVRFPATVPPLPPRTSCDDLCPEKAIEIPNGLRDDIGRWCSILMDGFKASVDC